MIAQQGAQLTLSEIGEWRLQLEQAKQNLKILKPELQKLLFGAGKK